MKKSFTQKVNQTAKQVDQLKIFSNTKNTTMPPLNTVKSPSQGLFNNTSDQNDLLNAIRNNDMLKNSRTSKQTTLKTVKRPQLTNYAMN